MNPHIGELAELYVLGSLSSGERTTVERHLRRCARCADRVRAAEETMAFISDLEEHHEPPQTIAESFAARLAASRAAQKALSLKVIATVVAAGAVLIGR
jgi:anti-sigma-K factor RskA